MPDRFGLRKATSIGPSREFDDSKLRIGVMPLTRPGTELGNETLRNLNLNLVTEAAAKLKNRGLKYVDENVENPIYKIGLKTILNSPELLRLRNPASAIKKGGIGPVQKSEKATEKWLDSLSGEGQELKAKDFHTKFLQNLRNILSKQGNAS